MTVWGEPNEPLPEWTPGWLPVLLIVIVCLALAGPAWDQQEASYERPVPQAVSR